MSALDRVVATAIEHRVPLAVNWVRSWRGPVPIVTLLIDGAKVSVHFKPGSLGWQFNGAIVQNREIRTLRELLEMIAAEGQRIDADMGGDAA